MELSVLMPRINRDELAASVHLSVEERGYVVMHCFEYYAQFVQLMYQRGTGDGSFERQAEKKGWSLIENGNCCRQYAFHPQVRICKHCGAGVNGNVVYQKDVFPEV